MYGNPVEICVEFLLFFLRRKPEKRRSLVFSGTPLLSILFVPRVFCAYLFYSPVGLGGLQKCVDSGRFYPLENANGVLLDP